MTEFMCSQEKYVFRVFSNEKAVFDRNRRFAIKMG